MNSYKIIKYIAYGLSFLGVVFVLMIQMMDMAQISAVDPLAVSSIPKG